MFMYGRLVKVKYRSVEIGLDWFMFNWAFHLYFSRLFLMLLGKVRLG